VSVRFEDLPEDVRAEIEAERQAAKERAAAAEPEFRRQLDELTAKVDAARSTPAPAEGLDLTAAVEAAGQIIVGAGIGIVAMTPAERAVVTTAIAAAAPHVLRAAAEHAARLPVGGPTGRPVGVVRWLRALADEIGGRR
jgi:hypothetical protein